jgi:hypothetical protein
LVDGVDTMVNTRTAGLRGNILIAEAVGDFTLRNGNRIVCVRQVSAKLIPASVEIGSAVPDAAPTSVVNQKAATRSDFRPSPNGKEW